MKKTDMSYFSPGDIIRPKENALLYDKFAPFENTDDAELLKSIKEIGIQEPLHISADFRLLSGHRRFAVALILNIDVPCIVHSDIFFEQLNESERLQLLSSFNKQRDKTFSENLRESMLKINPDEAYEKLLKNRIKNFYPPIECNLQLGAIKKRPKITTRLFLEASKNVIYTEKKYWPLSVRRVHYLLLNNPPIKHDKKPDKIYKNDPSSYKTLSGLLTRARLNGEIPMESIEDETRPITVWQTYQNPAEYIKTETEEYLCYYQRDLLRSQPHHIEVVVEKNAIRRIVEDVCSEYCISCTTTRGFTSLSPRVKMVERFQKSGKRNLIILMLTDFDLDGEKISESYAESIRDDFCITNLTPYKVLLNKDDILKYNIPLELEAKSSTNNYNSFVSKYGPLAAELDACPVDLIQDRLRDAIERCLDMDLFLKEQMQERDDAAHIDAIKQNIINYFSKVDI